MEENQRPSRQIGVIVAVVGVALALISGLAETVGIGGGTFGWKQVLGVVVGCVVALAGLAIVLGVPARLGTSATSEAPASEPPSDE